MTEKTSSWNMEGAVVLLPQNAPDDVYDDFIRLGAEVLYSDEDATHEYIARGVDKQTDLPAISAAELAAKVAAAKESYKDFMAPHIREANIPIVAVCTSDEEGAQSRYFGRPWLNDDNVWPERDGKPLKFVMQMDVSTFPGKPLGDNGLLVFFHLDTDTDMSDAFIVDTTMPGSLRDAPEGVHVNPALKIVDWKSVPDVLWGDDRMDLDGVEEFEGIEDYFGDTIGEYIGSDGEAYNEHEGVKLGILPGLHTFECDKVGGQPRWEQGNETPEDEDGNPMTYILQLGHKGVVGDYDQTSIDFPIWGRGHLFYSKETGEFKFPWACD
jgi:hypothetical protein